MGRFENVADISFIGDISINDIVALCSKSWREKYKALTGEDSDIPIEEQSHIYAYSVQLYQMAQSINEKSKQNFLKYATGEYLDNIALNSGIVRRQSEQSVVTVKFTASEAHEGVIPIPLGTRVTSAAAKIYFATTEYGEIAEGETETEIVCKALTGGSLGNEFAVGEINVPVDTIAYISDVSNIEVPTGGADAEDDDELAERVFNSKNVYSTAGAEDAYKYYVKEFSGLIEDIYISNPSGADIVISILMSDRKEASESFINDLTAYITSPSIKAMTDRITVKNADRIDYGIDVGYYIAESDAGNISSIQKNVLGAVEEYKLWQSEKIGRDINPQKLITLMINAGAKRVVISSGENVTVAAECIANCISQKIEYLGLEDD